MFRHNTPWRAGYLKCSTDIAKYGRAFAETFVMTMAEFRTESFASGYATRLQETFPN